eukprot:Sspe_Gene.62894::Locus_35611_Transcript_1_1_Confidence_1.000_Length_473::g.62894::m.62894
MTMTAEAAWSKLNNRMQGICGIRLQQWPRLKVLLKSYSRADGGPKQSKAFTLNQIQQLAGRDDQEPYWVVWQAACIVMFCNRLPSEVGPNENEGKKNVKNA